MNLGKESETIEFKESSSELKAGIRSITSMLNKKQHCLLYFGVKDNGDMIGQEIGSNTLGIFRRPSQSALSLLSCRLSLLWVVPKNI